MTPCIIEAKATGDEVARIIYERILPNVVNEERSKVIIALLTMTLSMMKPDITPEEIQEGVKGTSEYICLFLGDTDNNPLDEFGEEAAGKKPRMN